MSLIGPWNILAGASNPTGYTIDQSLRFDDGDSTSLDWTPSGAGSLTTWTYSTWIKRGNIVSAGASDMTFFSAGGGSAIDNLQIQDTFDTLNFGIYNSGNVGRKRTSAVQRDPGSWYHFVLVWDTTNGSSSDRMRIYINGERVTAFEVQSEDPAEDAVTVINSAVQHSIGRQGDGSEYWDGYMAEVYFIDGQALTAASFGETNEDTNQWQAIKYAGTYGTNGFLLKFEDSADLGNDSSGNGNDFTSTNLAATDQMLDTPSNNFSVMNPIQNFWNNANFSQGNLRVDDDGGEYMYNTSTIGMSSGKWYWEVLDIEESNYDLIGIATSYPVSNTEYLARLNTQWAYYSHTGNVLNNDNNTGSGVSYGATYGDGDIIGVALDLDNNKIYWSKNGTWQNSGDPTSGATGTGAISITALSSSFGMGVYVAASGDWNDSATDVMKAQYNFGSDSSFSGQKTAQGNADGNAIGDFYYSVPSGYLALCTSNLPDPSIAISGENFNPVIYTGNAAASHAVTGVGFQPDLTWLKKYEDTDKHTLYDAVRTATYYLTPDTTAAENQENTSLKSFDSDGFTVGDWDDVNGNGSSFVSWNWLAGGGGGSSNTDGDTNTVSTSANVTAGFSISTLAPYAGSTTFGHGLSAAPELVIMKPTNGVDVWLVGSDPVGWTKGLVLNTTATPSTNTVYWNNTAPTATVVSLGTQGNSYSKVFYCFHSVEGYSKVGSWVGNGNADGTFIYTGFRPAMVLSKDISSANNWVIVDDARNTYNVANSRLRPNTTAAQSTDLTCFDFVSNGFKVRTSDGDLNANTYTYIYLAFAEFPFKYSNAR